jgi:spermidine synthase
MRSPALLAPPAVTLAALGFAAAVAQAVLLREAMAAIGGSELAWGAVLAVWLAAIGAGAWLGSRWGRPRLARFGPLGLLLLTGAAVVLVRAAPALTGIGGGEAATAWRDAWIWAFGVAAPAVAGGWCFPVAAAALAGADGPAAAYAIESAGGMLGGLTFTFLLAPGGAAAAVCVAAGISAAALLLLGGRRAAWFAPAPLLAGLVLAAPAGRALETASWRWSAKPGALADWRETHLQRLELAAGSPAVIYADGRLAASFPEPYGTVPRAHLLMLLHPHPERVLVVGAADGGFVTMLHHPVRRLVAIEEDPGLAAVLPRWLGPPAAAAFADPRFALAAGDPVRLVRRSGGWDLLALTDGDPTTLRRNRTRTVEFFEACRRALAPGGILAVRVGVGDTYLGGAGGRLLAIEAATLARVFPDVVGVPGDEVLLLAGRDRGTVSVDPAALLARWRARGVRDADFDPRTLPLLLDPERGAALQAFIAASRAPVDTARHPRAVLLATALREARGAPALLAAARSLERLAPAVLGAVLAFAAALLVARAAGGAAFGVEAGAVVGLAAMGWWVLLLACWQERVGSVYGEVGALSAAFMAGTVAGAWSARRRPRPGPVTLAGVLAGGTVLSLAIAAGLPLSFPRVAVVALLLAGGALTGAAFPSVARLAGPSTPRRGAGRGFAADEAGAAAAALLVGLVVLPWAGLASGALGLAALGGAAAAALLLVARRARREG